MSENTKIFEIKINGIKESVTNLESLEEVLNKMEAQVENINKNGGFSVVSKEANKNTKEAIDLAKAEEIAQGEVISSYKEKQKALSTLGKEIKSMTTADAEATKRQQELIGEYNELNSTLKRFDASMGNHQRNVGDYRGALKEAKDELKNLQGQMVGLDQHSAAFQALATEAGNLKDRINDVNDAIKRQASDTKSLDAVIDYAKSATAAFQLYNGAMSAFGVETKEAEEAMQQLMGAMSIVQSLQTLSETFKSTSATGQLFHKMLNLIGIELKTVSTNENAAAASTTALATAEGTATVATKGLNVGLKATRLALSSLGIGLIITLVATLVEHWEDLVEWVNNLIPGLKKTGGLFNTLKGVAVGLGKAVVNWLVNPFKTFANVIGKILSGDFKGAWNAAIDGVKNQFTGMTKAFEEGFKDTVEKGLEDITRKQAEESDKQLTHQKNMITKQKNADGTYRKEYIEANKKMFDNRKKMYKKDSDEYKKVLEEEAAFYQQVEDAKTSATKKGAADRTKASKDAAKEEAKAAAEAEKLEKERQKNLADSEKKLDNSFYDAFQLDVKEDLRKAGLEVEKFADGPLVELTEALIEYEKIQQRVLGGESEKAATELFNSLDDNVKHVIQSLEDVHAVIENKGYLTEEIENVKSVWDATFDNEDELKAYLNNLKAFQISCSVIAKKLDTDIEIAHDELYKKIGEGAKKTGQSILKNATNTYNNLLEDLKKLNVEPVRNKFTGLIDTKKTKEKFEAIKWQWKDAADVINDAVLTSEDKWDEYIKKMAILYGEDSQKYKDTVQEKIEALRKLERMQDEVNRRAATPVSLNNDYNGDNKPDVEGPKRKLWDKQDDLLSNMSNMFQSLDEMVLGPAMDTFSMYMDFAIAETQAKLEEVQEMHDDALDKVEESADKIKELNDSIKDSSNGNLEATKQQLADEQLLYAQRLAEEQKLAEREKDLKNKANEQEYQARKMELGYQLFLGIANTAQGVSKALAQWGWPLGPIFAGVMASLGAVQTAIIAKQLSSLPKPKKLAEGGLLSGPSHAKGGIRLGNVEVEGGEAVINKRSTSKFLPILDAINAAGNGGKHTLADKKIRRFANGGQLNFEKVDSNLRQNNETNRILGALDNINFQPVVSVVDFENVQSRLTRVRSLAGR